MAQTPQRQISRIPGEGAGVIGYDPSKTPEAGSIGEYLNLQMTFKTIAAAQAALILPAVTRINTLFYDDNQAEGSGATYRRVASEPSHPGKFQTLGGAWWEIALLTVNSRMFGAVGNGDPANMVADTYGAQRATDFSSATLKRIVEPVAHYCIDGYKGANASWSAGEAASGGIIVRPGTVWHGAGRGLTIFHNTANNSRCVFRIRVDGKYTIKHMTVDVDRQNYTPIPYGTTSISTGSVRGEGIIFEGNGVTYVTGIEFVIDDIESNNSGHYGIGAQNVKTGFGRIVNSTFRNPGGDGIDIKSFSTPDLTKTTYILNCHFPDGCGNYYLGTGEDAEEATNENQTCIDASGATLIDGIHIDNLDSDPLSLGNCGIRVRPSVTSTSRLGGQRTIINNVRIRCSKPVNTGSPSARRIVGLMVNAEEVQISNVTVDGAYWGVRLMDSGDSIPSNCNLSNVTVLNCNGAANDGIGLSVTAAVRRVNVANVQAKGNQIGLTVNCQGSAFQNVVLENNGLGVSAPDGAISLNNFRNFRYSGNTLDHNATLSPRPGIASGGQPYGLTIYTASATLPLTAVGLTIQAQPAAAAVQLQMPAGAQTGDEIDVQKITGSGAGLVQVKNTAGTIVFNIPDIGGIVKMRFSGTEWAPVDRYVSDRSITILPTPAASIPSPSSPGRTLFLDSSNGNLLSVKDSAGAVTVV